MCFFIFYSLIPFLIACTVRFTILLKSTVNLSGLDVKSGLNDVIWFINMSIHSVFSSLTGNSGKKERCQKTPNWSAKNFRIMKASRRITEYGGFSSMAINGRLSASKTFIAALACKQRVFLNRTVRNALTGPVLIRFVHWIVNAKERASSAGSG